MQLQAKDQLMIDNAGIKKIAYDFRRDRRTAQLCSCDITPQLWLNLRARCMVKLT